MPGILDPGQAERVQGDKHSLHLIISQVVSRYNHSVLLTNRNRNVHSESQGESACQELRYLFPLWSPLTRHLYPDRQLSICMTLGGPVPSGGRAGHFLSLLGTLQEAVAGHSMDGLNEVAAQFTLGYFS